jgi:hypothetical protein
MRFMPKPGENLKWYHMPFALVYGLWQIFVKRKDID